MEKDKEQSNLSRTLEDLLKKDKSDLSKKTIEDLLKKISKRTDDLSDMQKRMERQAREQAKAQGKGIIGQTIAAAKAGSKTEEQYQIAKKGIKSGKRKFFKTLFGDVGDWVDAFEEKASEEEIAQSKKALGMDKEKKKAATARKSSVAMSSKKLSSILKNTTDIKKTIQKIEKILTKPSLRAGFEFDPRLGTKGGFRETSTGKVASKEAATTTPATDRLGKLISADEEPLVLLRERFESFEEKTNETLNVIKGKVESAVLSLNGVTPTLGLMSVHDKLNVIMAKGGGGFDIDRRRKKRGRTRKPPGKVGGVKGALGKAGSLAKGAGRVLGKAAVPLAVGMAAYDAYQAGSNAEQTLGIEGREATTGETVAAGVGGAVEGLTFGLVSAKTVGTGLVSAGEAVSGATKKLWNWATGDSSLDKVTTKQNSNVDTSNFEGGFEDRLAKMATKFEEVTGNKLMITSGYRSEEKQKELWDAKKAELTKAHPDWSAAQIDKAVAKLVARPAAYGGKGSRHNSGLAVDINSKGSAGIEAINGAVIGGEKVSTDSFLAKYGLFRPMKHEPWHIQPLGDKPMPDNPDPNSKALVADASGKAMNLESGKTEAIPRAEVQAGMSAGLEAPAPISGGAQIADTGGGTSTGGAQIGDSGSGLVARAATAPGLETKPATEPGLVTPVQRTNGMQVAQQSAELASNQMAASMNKPAPVVVNNVSNGGNQQPVQPPKRPLPTASALNNNNTYNRAFAKDFAHPSSFTSVGMI